MKSACIIPVLCALLTCSCGGVDEPMSVGWSGKGESDNKGEKRVESYDLFFQRLSLEDGRYLVCNRGSAESPAGVEVAFYADPKISIPTCDSDSWMVTGDLITRPKATIKKELPSLCKMCCHADSVSFGEATVVVGLIDPFCQQPDEIDTNNRLSVPGPGAED